MPSQKTAPNLHPGAALKHVKHAKQAKQAKHVKHVKQAKHVKHAKHAKHAKRKIYSILQNSRDVGLQLRGGYIGILQKGLIPL